MSEAEYYAWEDKDKEFAGVFARKHGLIIPGAIDGDPPPLDEDGALKKKIKVKDRPPRAV
jgi:hypothetical protein